MKLARTLLLVASCAGVVAAQDNPLATELKGRYTGIKTLLLKAADKMDDFNYKPVDTIRTFGGLIGHIADAQAGACSRVAGAPKQLGASAKTNKAELVAALKESFTICDAVFDSLKDSDLSQMMAAGQRQVSKSAALWGTIVHSNEEYGYLAVYMRMKGVVPPSSEPRGN